MIIITTIISGSESVSAIVCRTVSTHRHPACYFQPVLYCDIRGLEL